MKIELRIIGRVRSTLVDPAAAPRQGSEGAPDAWIEIDPQFTWLYLARTIGAEELVHVTDQRIGPGN